LHLNTVTHELPAAKPAVELLKGATLGPVRQRRIHGPLLCDLCRSQRAVGYTEGVSGEPDAITVYCWNCGDGRMKLFEHP
jgi:hypothetical protein